MDYDVNEPKDFGWDDIFFDEEDELESNQGSYFDFEDEDEAPLEVSMPDFVMFSFRMPLHPKEGEPVPKELFEYFSFEPRPHMWHLYETTARRILLICGRQCEKSTFIGNRAITTSCLIPSHKSLYIAPSGIQVKTFSNDRIKEPIETSPRLRTFAKDMVTQNIFEKQFHNRSKLTLRSAFLTADRARGVPAHKLYIDEFQDVIAGNIPVLEQCTAHSPDHLKGFIYSGTPKSMDNTIEQYRVHRSTMSEWVVPCDRCGASSGAGRYWNVLGEKNIGKKGLICARCGKLIHAQHRDAQWANMVQLDPPHVVYESYRINQLMVPWKPWEEILIEYTNTPRAQFYNEVLGLSYDTGLRPLTESILRTCCDPNRGMSMSELANFRSDMWSDVVYAGIDWGHGEGAYTVMTIATYVQNKFTVIYAHRFTGPDVEPVPQMKKIHELIKFFNVNLIGTDYGAGHVQNDELVRTYGRARVFRYMHLGRPRRKVEWNSRKGLYMLHRTDIMADLFNAIRRRQISFPRWEDFKDPFGQDYLNIFSEYSRQTMTIKYNHRPGQTDDSFHSLLYTLLVSILHRPRPDIVAPNKENKDGVSESLIHPVWQG